MIKRLLFCLAFLCVLGGFENVYASPLMSEEDGIASYTSTVVAQRTNEDGVNKYYIDEQEVTRDEYYQILVAQEVSSYRYEYANTDIELQREDTIIILPQVYSQRGSIWYASQEEALAYLTNYYLTYPTENFNIAFISDMDYMEIKQAVIGDTSNRGVFPNIVNYWVRTGRLNIVLTYSTEKPDVCVVKASGGALSATDTTVAEYQQCIQIADQIAAQTAGMDRYNQIKYVNDYLCNTITYMDVTHSLE